MKTIVYISTDVGVPIFGCKGCSVHVQEIIYALLDAGYAVHVVTTNLGVGFHELSAKVSIDVISGIDFNIMQSGDLEVQKKCVQNLNQRITATLLKVRGHREIDFVYERFALWAHAGMEFARDHGVPGVLEVNAPLLDEQNTYRTPVNKFLADGSASRAFIASTRLIAVSTGIKNYLNSMGVGDRKVVVVPNAARPSRFSAFPSISRLNKEKEFTIGFVGSMKKWHGLDTLIDAFYMVVNQVPDSMLLLVGEGPELAGVVKRSENYGIRYSVVTTGSVHPADVGAYMRAMDVAVAPYPKLDNFYFSPLKVFEYMSCGLPVIASAIGQMTEIVEHGWNGWLVQPDDPLDLKKAIIYLRSNHIVRRRLAMHGKDFVTKNYTWRIVVDKIIDIVNYARLNGELTTIN